MEKLKQTLKLGKSKTEKEKKQKSDKRLKSDDQLLKVLETDNGEILRPILANKQFDFNREIHWDTHFVSEVLYPIHFVATLPRPDLLELFLRYKCPVDLQTESGLNALHFVAIYKGCTENIDHLVDDAIDVGAVDTNGRTVLHWACEKKNHKFVKKMLDLNLLDAFEKDNNGFTPLDIAKTQNCRQTIKLLQEHDRRQETANHGNSEDHESRQKIEEVMRKNKELAKENQNLRARTQMYMSLQDIRTFEFTDNKSSSTLADSNTSLHGSQTSVRKHPFRHTIASRPSTNRARSNSLRSLSMSLPSVNENVGYGDFEIPGFLSKQRRDAIQSNLSIFLNGMTPSIDSIMIKLFEKNVLDRSSYLKAQNLKTDKEKSNFIILQEIYSRSNKDCDKFVEILKEHGMDSLSELLSPKDLQVECGQSVNKTGDNEMEPNGKDKKDDAVVRFAITRGSENISGPYSAQEKAKKNMSKPQQRRNSTETNNLFDKYFQTFENELLREWPEFLQGYTPDETNNQILIHLEDSCASSAEENFKRKYENTMENKVKLRMCRDGPLDLLADNFGSEYRNKIEMGTSVLTVVAAETETHRCRENYECPSSDKEHTIESTLGCFVEDSNNDKIIYILTAMHTIFLLRKNLHKKLEENQTELKELQKSLFIRENMDKPDLQEKWRKLVVAQTELEDCIAKLEKDLPNSFGPYKISSLSFFVRYDKGDSDTKRVHVSNRAMGYLGNHNGIGVDIIAIEVSKDLLKKHPFLFDVPYKRGQRLKPVIPDSDFKLSDLAGKSVFKNCARCNGQTHGLIDLQYTKFTTRLFGTVFTNLVAIRKDESCKFPDFAFPGCSGSVVFRPHLGHKEAKCIGFVLGKRNESERREGTQNVTYLVRFKESIQALERNFNLRLSLVSDASHNPSAMSIRAVPNRPENETRCKKCQNGFERFSSKCKCGKMYHTECKTGKRSDHCDTCESFKNGTVSQV